MKPSFKAGLALFGAALLSLAALAQTKRPMTFDDLTAIKRVGDAQISPDGSRVAYVVTEVDKNLNRGKRSVWVVSASGGPPRQLITSDKNDFSPRWSAEGKWIAFLSTREGAPQIFVAGADGSNPRKVTGVPEGVGEFIWSPDGKMFAFTTDVYPDCGNLNCVAKRGEAEEKSKVKAVVADRLLYRHWDSFKRGKRSHLFVVSSEAGGSGSEPKDLTPGDYDVPPFSLGDPAAFDFAPDSSEIVFARNTDKVEATSTNNDLFIVSVSGGDAKRITGNNPGSDTTPRYSPDGKYIAYRSQARNGYESDRFRLMLYDRKAGTSKEISTGFDRWVGELVWAPDSQNIFIGAEDRGRELIGVASINGGVKPLIADTASSGISLSSDGKTLAFTRSNFAAPAEVFAAISNGSDVRQLTQANASLMAQLDLNPAEDFEYKGAKTSVVRTAKLGKLQASTDIGPGRTAMIHGFIIKPPQFDKSKKYPMILLIHGGPRGAWLDSWGYRWNADVGGARLRHGVDQSPRFDRLRPGLHRTDQRRMGRRRLRRPDEGRGSHDQARLRRPEPPGRGRRLLRRVHGRLDSGPHRPPQGAGLARRRLQPDQHVRDRRAVVRRLGVQRHSVGQPGTLHKMVAPSERQKFQDPDAGRSRRAGLPRPGRRRAATLLDLAAQGRPVEAALLPGRRPLDSEAAEQRTLVQNRARLVRSVAEA